MIFEFTVRRLRWLGRVPLAPQFFDALLLAWTGLFHRERLAAMEEIETQALALPGVRLCNHRFGGIGFTRDTCEFAHLHGNGLLDVHLTREHAEAMIVAGRARPHHVFGLSAWVSFWVRSKGDLPNATRLLAHGMNREELATLQKKPQAERQTSALPAAQR